MARNDALTQQSAELRDQLRSVARGGTMKAGGGPTGYTKNDKGSIANEVMAFLYPLADMDTIYSIIGSSVVATILNRTVTSQKPSSTSFLRETATFVLFELLQPKLSGVLPRIGITSGDMDVHRYRAGKIAATNARLTYAASGTEVEGQWDWKVMFQEVANTTPTLLLSMVIVDMALGFRSDLGSLLHYLLVMLLVGVGRFAKNSILVNNPARQSKVEIFRRAMALGLSYEKVPKAEFKGKLPPRVTPYDKETGK